MLHFHCPKIIDRGAVFVDQASFERDQSAANSVSVRFDDDFYALAHEDAQTLVDVGDFPHLEDHWVTLGMAAGFPARRKLMANPAFLLYQQKLDEWGIKKPLNLCIVASIVPASTQARRLLRSIACQSVGFFKLVLIVPSATDVDAAQALLAEEGLDFKVMRIIPHQQFSLSDVALLAKDCTHVTFVDQSSVLSMDTVFSLALDLPRFEGASAVYTDEGLLNDGFSPPSFRKPDWSPQYFLSTAYTCGLTFFSAHFFNEALDSIDAVDLPVIEFALMLIALEMDRHIAHLEKVLVWTEDATDEDVQHRRARIRGIVDTCVRTSLPQTCVFENDELYLPRIRSGGTAALSIVIPSADGQTVFRGRQINLLDACIQGIRLASEAISSVEIVIVYNNDMPKRRVSELRSAGCSLVLFEDRNFNFAKKINIGVAASNEEALLLLNDDIISDDTEWLARQMGLLALPGVGAVGPKLLFPNGRMQHCGCGFFRGTPYHPYHGLNPSGLTYAGMGDSVRNVAAVTGACLMTRRSLFDSVGRFDERLFDLYNDADYCLRLRRGGYQIVYSGRESLIHLESVSLAPERIHGDQKKLFEDRWGSSLELDPYYNSGISLWAPYRQRYLIETGWGDFAEATSSA